MKRQELVVLVVVVGVLVHGIFSVMIDGNAFQKFQLAKESDYASKHPPAVVDVSYYMQWIPMTMRCLNHCVSKGDCTFFSVKGTNCWLWTLGLDPSYSTGDFGPDTNPAYMRVLSPPPPQDIALGKPVTAQSDLNGYNLEMLTGGSLDFSVAKDCFCSGGGYDKQIQVDLKAEYFVSKVALMSSVSTHTKYFLEIKITAGRTGNYTLDPLIGVTSSEEPPPLTTFEFPVNDIVRYVSLNRREDGFYVCLCKIQAFL